MIIEYGQLLSAAHWIKDGSSKKVSYKTASGKDRSKDVFVLPDYRQDILYKCTHVNHPSSVWARKTLKNYMWLAELLENVCAEYTHRYGRVHKLQASGLLDVLKKPPKYWMFPREDSEINMTEIPQAMPDEFKNEDPVIAYQTFYIKDKIRFTKWTNRKAPGFFAKAVGNTQNFERTR